MAETKTRATAVSVAHYIADLSPAGKQADALALDALFRRITGFEPRMWGPTMIGYGRYDYVYASGHGGSAMATGFSPRKAEHSIYALAGQDGFQRILDRLGKYKIGKACLYVRRLSDVDMAVLEELIRAGLADLATRWTIHPA
jgi:hypothetical protein